MKNALILLIIYLKSSTLPLFFLNIQSLINSKVFLVVAAGIPEVSIGGAVALALGIGLQNFPEGIAVSMPSA